jgi:hypothetical protein
VHVRNHLILAASLVCAAPWATGQTVWRCGNSYGQQPCEGGAAMAAPAAAPSAADARQAAASAKADAQRAEAMEQARLAQEKNAPKAIAIVPLEPAKAEPAKSVTAKARKPAKPEHFTATVPGSGKKKN